MSHCHFAKCSRHRAWSTNANLQHISTISIIPSNIQTKSMVSWCETILHNASIFKCLVFLFILRNMIEILQCCLVRYYIFCKSVWICITFLQKDDLAFCSHFQPLQENVCASALIPTHSGIFPLTIGFFWN